MASKTAKQQFLVIASAALFFGTTAATAIQFVTQMAKESAPVADNRTMLQQQAQDYETILQREPDNQAALEGLMRSRMALGDRQGATEPLARLIELNPQRQDYVDLMRRLQAQQTSLPAGGINPFAGGVPIEFK